MTTVKDITTMCKAGRLAEAYDMAKADLDASPQEIWVQRGMGWALYYMIKEDVDDGRKVDLWTHLEELVNLDLLNMENDSLIFDRVLWNLAEFAKNLPLEDTDDMDRLFALIARYSFNPSMSYSYLLKSCIRFETWDRLGDFFEWWNIDKLLPEDYQPFKKDNGRSIMSLAERAYIAYAKVLLRLRDRDKIAAFFQKLEKLMDDYPSMVYPGYFCGKLLLAMGADKEAALESVMPFVRKKQSEFWVWQLLSEIYKDEEEMHLACLLRAVHCKTQEGFLGKVRMKLVAAYLRQNDYSRARFQVDSIAQCYTSQGWHLPYEVQNWLRESWARQSEPDSSDGIDYRRLTDSILLYGTNSDIAVVIYVDGNNRHAVVVYGEKKRKMLRTSDLRIKVRVGTIMKLYWLPQQGGNMNIIKAELANPAALKDISYMKWLKGNVEKRPDKDFAFIRENGMRCFISPQVVGRYQLEGGENITALAVYNYNKKKDEWGWSCVALKKNKE